MGGSLCHRRRHAQVRAPVLRPDGLPRPARPPPRLGADASQRQTQAKRIAESDADADLRLDKDDKCPRRYAATRDGCVHLALSVKLRRSKAGFAGTVDAERDCLRRSSNGGPSFIKVTLMRVDDGRDLVAGADALGRGGKFSFAKALRGRLFYVRVTQRLRPGLLLCKGARSPALRAG